MDGIWKKIELFFYFALIIELSVAAILNIPLLKDLLRSTLTKSIKSLLVLLIAVGLVFNISEIRLFAGMKIKVSESIDILFSTLFLARFSNLLHDFFKTLKERAQRELG